MHCTALFLKVAEFEEEKKKRKPSCGSMWSFPFSHWRWSICFYLRGTAFDLKHWFFFFPFVFCKSYAAFFNASPSPQSILYDLSWRVVIPFFLKQFGKGRSHSFAQISFVCNRWTYPIFETSTSLLLRPLKMKPVCSWCGSTEYVVGVSKSAFLAGTIGTWLT